MGLKDTIRKYIDNFAEIPTTASISAMERNPVDESLKALLYNPKYKKIGKYEYISFGQNDDIDQVLSALKNKSATHAGIINRKSKLVAGNSLTSNFDDKKDFKAFMNRAGGVLGKTLEYEWKKFVNIYESNGTSGLLVKKKGKDIVMMNALSPLQMRVAKLNNDNEIENILVRPTFNKSSGQIYKNSERLVPLFDPDKNQKEFIIYVTNPATDNPFYGVPNYIGAYNFIEADYKFGVTINNSAENGFQPKVMLTFIGRGMSQDQKDDHAEKVKDNFIGARGEIAMVNYVRKLDEMPRVDNLAIENLDKTISVMAELNDNKILTAHSVTNPSLFGVSVAGKLGNSGTELESSYNIFMAAEALPDRKLLLDNLTLAFAGSKWEKIEFEVEDVPVMPAENRGNNVDAPSSGTDKDKTNE